jgi:trimeric autotransporter adhesin
MIMGCVSDSSDVVNVIVKPIPTPPTLSATPSTITLGNTSSLSATGCTGGTITWSLGGATTNPLVVTPASSTNYTATCTQNGCVSPASASVLVTVNSTEPCTSLLNLVSTADDYSTGIRLKQASISGGKITAINKITGSSTVTYQAPSILLNSGFKADNGTIFKAETGGCN